MQPEGSPALVPRSLSLMLAGLARPAFPGTLLVMVRLMSRDDAGNESTRADFRGKAARGLLGSLESAGDQEQGASPEA